jgi:hypothetical protein
MSEISTGYSDKKVIILLEEIDRLALHALSYARENSKEITAFSAITRQEKEAKLRSQWEKVNSGSPYIIRYSESKSAGTLLLEYIDSLECGGEITVLVPLVIMKSWWQKYLNRSYLKRLERSFNGRDNVVLVKVPYYLDQAA